jgi:intracellular septation protein A
VSAARDETIAFAPASVGTVVRRAGPRLVRDAFGPLACFFAGWKLIDLTAGIAIAAAFGLAIYAHERRAKRPAVVVRIALVLVAIRASVGLSSGSASTYLAQEIGIDTLLGCVVLGSLRTERPFTSWFTEEVFPLPQEILRTDMWRSAMRFTTLVWGCYFLTRALVRLAALLTLSTNAYVLVAALSDAPFLVGLLAWSIYYTTNVFRSDPQWGPLLAHAEAGGELTASLLPPQPPLPQPLPAPDPTRR